METAMGEREYLENQCQRAKAGMRVAIHDLKTDAIEIADPRVWARAHPLATVAAAVAAGFAATRVIGTNKEPAEMRQPQTAPPVEHRPGPIEHRPGRLVRMLSITQKIWSAAEPFVRAAIVARMSQAEAARQAETAA
jgi:hypothetical protein